MWSVEVSSGSWRDATSYRTNYSTSLLPEPGRDGPWPKQLQDAAQNRQPMTELPTTSTRALDAIASALTKWFQGHPDLEAPSVELRGRPRGAGLSSDTVLFDLSWHDAKGDHCRGYVLRMPPPADAYPLFPWYDLDRQVR